MSTVVCWFQRTLKQLEREQTDTQTHRTTTVTLTHARRGLINNYMGQGWRLVTHNCLPYTCAFATIYNPHYSPFSELCHLIVGHVPTKVLQVELSMVQSLLLDMELFCQPLQPEILLSVSILPVTGLTQPPL